MSRNVVMVSIDSLRADHCGFHGYEKDTTPTMDAMAEDGFVFENAIAPGPATPTSMPAVFTGEFVKPYSTDDDAVIANRRANISRHMRENRTLPERLSTEGYTTIGFSPNPFTSRYFGFERGFDEYTDFLDRDDRLLARVYDGLFRRFISGNTQLTPIRLLLNYLEGEEIFKSWEQYYENVLSAIEDVSEPYFLWVFLLDTHLPYFVGRSRRDGVSWREMWRYNLRLYRSDPRFDDEELDALIELYDATVGRADEFLTRLTDDLEDDDPVYFVHSDHGEAFGEHGMYGHEPYAYEENLHVPYFVANGDWSGTRSAPVSLREIPAHVVAHAGETVPADPPTSQRATGVLANPFGVRAAVRADDWKYIWRPDVGGGEEVYALPGDPNEERNLAGTSDAPTGSDALEEGRGGGVTTTLGRLADLRIADERERLAVSNAIDALGGAEDL